MTSKILIRNGSVLHCNDLDHNTDVRIEGNKIVSIGSGLVAEAGEEVLDADGCYALPGLIDLHTHGLGDINLREGGWSEYAELQLAQGVTACLPTLFDSPGDSIACMQIACRETDELRSTPNLLGFRLEMPYLAKLGAGHASAVATISAETTEAMYEAGRGLIRLWDVSPELAGALSFIRWATDHGIITSLAHSSATVEQTRQAIEAGLSLVTHFYDTFDLPSQTDPGVYPAGLTDYIQVEDRLTVEIVADGIHVHPYLLEKTLRCKGINRIAFVTDSVLGAGKPPGVYSGLYAGVQVAVTTDRGVRRLSDDTLSGSALTHLQSFQNAVQRFGRSIAEASALCSRTPARVLGLHNKGHLAVGTDADVILLDRDTLALKATLLQGKLAFRAA